MTILLPTSPAPAGATPLFRDFGGVLTPFMGGEEQTINRVGDRFGVRVTMPAMKTQQQGMLFVARLLRAKKERLLMRWPLNGFVPGAPGTPRVSATASGMVLPIKGLTPGYAAREGQWFSIIRAGRRYFHQFAADGEADGSGNLSGLIFPMLRRTMQVNDVIEIAEPMIEGHVLPGEELSWDLAVANFLSISFSVLEAA